MAEYRGPGVRGPGSFSSLGAALGWATGVFPHLPLISYAYALLAAGPGGAAAFATLGLTGPAQAQTTPTQDGPATRGGGRGGANMLKDLNLTADQQIKVDALMKDERAKGGLHGGQSGPPSDADRQAMQTRRTEMEAKMKEILTPEQYTKYQTLRSQRGQGRQRPSGDAPAN